jgi:hypothetical protein
VIVKGQRVFLRGIPAVVVDYGEGFATVELDGRIEIVAEAALVTAESVESAGSAEGIATKQRHSTY